MSLQPNVAALSVDPFLARLDGVIDRALAEKRIVGTVVLVARDGDRVYERAAGLADREARRGMASDTIFLLASITKPFVTVAAMRLVEQGVIGLDDPVSRWLPGFRPRMADGIEPVIRLRHLMSHSAGLSYGFLEPQGTPYHQLGVSDGLDHHPGLTLSENLRRLALAPLAFEPGAAWRYSLGMDVIGAVLEQASGESLPSLVRRLVTQPLGLADTGFAVTDRSRLATAYADGDPEPRLIEDGMDVPLWDQAVHFAPSRIFDPEAYPSGGAGMAGTAGEVLALLEAIRRDGAPLLQAETVRMMMTDQIGSEAQGPGWRFGLGWAVLDDPGLALSPQTKGTIRWGGAYGHNWFIDKESGLSVVVLTNTAFEGMSGAFSLDVRDAIYGVEPAPAR
ncbi:serine hydrolase domain-containing protein [Labrys sp. ZIDIC5]|uniref:serine hydrolase domain-containing protein n=1 Tax=Labrys sedimenti TaxID=3106036 RepID=UPI002ACA786D|nr:serine hydrolase domain-containing protein [Labrys sp. ZIDIC5]MDZ5449374.1 serine hydrolase domain-containing protein [Labrys sp. ZIDIC5]